MRKNIIVPLADDEELRFPFRPKDGVYINSIKTSEIGDKIYQHIFWSELGKYISYVKFFEIMHGRLGVDRSIFSQFNRIFGLSQNRRFFSNLNELNVYTDNDVILAKEEWLGGLNMFEQFKHCHPKWYPIFQDICNKLKVNEFVRSQKSFSPHNIFISKLSFFLQYSNFLNETLLPYFDENIDEKAGAWIGERLLYIFAHEYFKVRTERITVLEKI